MKIYESENDQFGTFINGLAYTLILAILLVLCCLIINVEWFDHTSTYIIIGIICFVFAASGLRKVRINKIGILNKLGRRDFQTYYSEGLWWVFPFSSFQEVDHFDVLQAYPGLPLEIKVTTKDKVRLSGKVKYYWKITDPKKFDKSGTNESFIKDNLQFALDLFIKNQNAQDMYCDTETSQKIMEKYLNDASERIGIKITDLFPIIDWDEEYNEVIRKNQADYERFKFDLEKQTQIKNLDHIELPIMTNQLLKLVKENGFTEEKAMEFLKIYKNRVSVDEKIYKIPGLEKVIESLINALSNRKK